ncbi:N-6 DNA methylase [Aquibacillus sediminis]|uniref:N-6 DNA methylase n=1 Tax=Aquibacillus sediminis TaxID=2574734 RepID=UPI001107E153|nr:N-6 DNA methylase [Aquibacillus sediminis]
MLTYIKELLIEMGFKLMEGEEGIWQKKYPNFSDYKITVEIKNEDRNSSVIDWGSKVNDTHGEIEVIRKTTSSLKQDENLVVLECVNRLLEKGYPPGSIVLEKDFKVGHKPGYLDVYVKDHENKCYLMIECKTFHGEYSKELNQLRKDGGQLLSYYSQDKNAKFVLLYSSKLENNEIIYKNDIIDCSELKDSNNLEEVFETWDKSTKVNGVFESWTTSYNIVFKNITRAQLVKLDEETGDGIYHQFAEILRRNVISDKTNAFNKIFNLFICKVYDEDRVVQPDDEMGFQITKEDSPNDVFNRLIELYKGGLQDYLDITLDDNYFSPINELGFIDVYNQDTFDRNYKVLEDVVKLIQNYEIRYTSKQQFLGDFFEKLLSTGIKQEAGQFFTPSPIARFICRSLPIQEIIQKKITDRDENSYLPYVIDYAAGSGHFLIEVMDEIQEHIDNMDEKEIRSSNTVRKNFRKERYDFDWAKEYIYGIEKDYRLAKTSKVSAFLNGDGDAKIFNADGLGNFYKDKHYDGRLETNVNVKDNQRFDLLIANPPYSVSGFKNTLSYGEESFDLYQKLTDQSKEIECLFIERAKQLVVDGGYIGIILPITILSNKGIHSEAREILVKNFDIKAIVELGNKTFMATPTKTVIIFARRRDASVSEKIGSVIDTFLINKKDVTCNGIEKAFSTYARKIYDIPLNQYIYLLKEDTFHLLEGSQLLKDYKEAFEPILEGIIQKINKVESKFKRSEKSLLKKINKKKTELKKIKDNNKKTEKHSELINEISELEFEHQELKETTEILIEQLEQSKTVEFVDYVKEEERKKLYYFMLTYNNNVLLVQVPDDTSEQKAFLGYEFVNRRGEEGIKIYRDYNGDMTSKLYNENMLSDESKANYYVLKILLEEEFDIHDDLKDKMRIKPMYSMINFEGGEFFNKISNTLINKSDYTFKTSFKNVKLNKLVTIKSGVVYDKEDEAQTKSGTRILTASNIDRDNSIIDLREEKYLKEDLEIEDEKKLRKNDIFICTSSGSLSHLGKIAFINNDMNEYFGGFCATLRTISDEYYMSKYIYNILKTKQFKNYILTFTGQNINNLSPENIYQFEIPVPDDHNIIKKVVDDTSTIESKVKIIKDKIIKLNNDNDSLISKLFSEAEETDRLGNFMDINPGIDEVSSLDEDTLITFLDMPSVSNEGEIINSELKRLKQVKSKGYRYFSEGDVLFAKITPSMENGKGAIAADLKNGIGFGSTEFFVLRANQRLRKELLFYITKQEFFRIEAHREMTGKSGHRRVPKEFLENYRIPVLSLDYQDEIIQKIKANKNKVRKLKEDLQILKMDEINIINTLLDLN